MILHFYSCALYQHYAIFLQCLLRRHFCIQNFMVQCKSQFTQVFPNSTHMYKYILLLLTYLVAFHPRPLKICMLKLVWTTSPRWKEQYLVMNRVPGNSPKNGGKGKIWKWIFKRNFASFLGGIFDAWFFKVFSCSALEVSSNMPKIFVKFLWHHFKNP